MSPRVSPAAELADVAALLLRTGYAMPVADAETITVTYSGCAGADARHPRHGRNQRAVGAPAHAIAPIHPGPHRGALCRTVRPSRRSDSSDLRDPVSDGPATMTTGPGIDEVRAAAARIRGLVRKTPLVTAAPVREQSDVARGLLLKLEIAAGYRVIQGARRNQCGFRIAAGSAGARHRHRVGRQSWACRGLCRLGRGSPRDDLSAALGCSR